MDLKKEFEEFKEEADRLKAEIIEKLENLDKNVNFYISNMDDLYIKKIENGVLLDINGFEYDLYDLNVYELMEVYEEIFK